jgi:hypothetical protein
MYHRSTSLCQSYVDRFSARRRRATALSGCRISDLDAIACLRCRGHTVADVENASGRNMTTPVRFAYANPDASRAEGSLIAVLADNAEPRHPCVDRYGVAGYGLNGQCAPIPHWSTAGLCVGTSADTSTPDGESCETAGARGDRLRPSASFPPVDLAFAWTQSTEVPMILGQVNFFMEFDVCFFRSQAALEVNPKSR